MKVLLLSTSTVYGKPYLEYCTSLLEDFYSNIKNLLFVPYARPGGMTYDDYTAVAATRFEKLGIKTTGIHENDNPTKSIQDAEAMFIGGGNTFFLLNELYANDLIFTIRDAVKYGMLYMGTSAGSNVGGLTVNNTNDMPIIYPPSFKSLGLLPFNLNPHYLDPNPDSKHKGETRETRIKEFFTLEQNNQPVVGLREGSGLLLKDNKLRLTGDLSARIFENEKEPYELNPTDDFNFLIKEHSESF